MSVVPDVVAGDIVTKTGLRRVVPGVLMALRPSTGGPSMSLCHPVKSCRRRVEFIEFSAPNPSRCQAAPCSFALWGAREFGHSPAFTGKLSEFLRGVH
jgi:hypothetical protein